MRRATARLALALAALLMIAPMQPGHALSLQGFRNDLVNLLLDKISVPGQFVVRADAVEDADGRRAVLTGLTVSDDRGVWFSAARLVFEWNPTALLRGEARITELRLDSGRLVRLPNTPPATPSGNENTAGTPTGPAPATSDAPTPWPRAPLALSVAALIVNDMQIADTVAPGGIAFDARGKFADAGPEQAATLNLTRTDAVAGKIEVSYAKRFDTGQLSLDINADEAPDGLVAALTGLPDDVPARLALNAAGPNGQLDGRLSVAAVGLFEAQGQTSARWADRLQLDLGLDVTPGARLDRAVAAAIGTTARLELDVREGDDSRVVVRSGRFTSGALVADLTGHLQRDNGALDLALEISAGQEAAGRISALIAPARLGGLQASVRVRGESGSRSVDGRVEVSAPRVGGLRATRGVVRLSASEAPSDRIDFRIDGNLAAPNDDDNRLGALLGPSVDLVVRGNRAGRLVTLDEVQVRGATIRASVDGALTVDGATVRPALRYRATLADLAALSGMTGMTLAGSGVASGDLSTGSSGTPRLTGTLEARGTRVNGTGLGTIALVHTIDLGEDITGPIDLRVSGGEWGDGRVRTRLRAGPAGVELAKLTASLPGLTATGDLSLPAGAVLPTGRLALVVDSLAPVARLAAVSATGRGRLELDLGGARASGIRVQGEFSELAVDAITLASASIDIDAELRNGQLTRVRQAKVRADRLVTPAGSLEQWSLDVSGPLGELRFATRGNGERDGIALSLDTAGVADVARTNRGQVRLETLTVTANEDRVTLQAPATLRWNGADISVAAMTLDLPDNGSAALAFSTGASRTTMRADLRQLPLALLGRLGLAPLTGGMVQGQVNLDTNPGAPTLDSTLTATNVLVEGVPANVGALSAELSSRWDGRTAQVGIRLSGPFETPLTGRLDLPLLARKDGGLPTPAKDAALDGRLEWEGELTPVFALLPVSDHLLSGTVSVDISIGGRLASPLLSGSVSMKNGRYENLLIGTIAENLTLDSRFQNADAIDFTLRGDDGNTGTLEVTGRIADLGATPRIDVAARARSFLALRLDAGSAVSSAAIDVRGTPAELDVTGRIDIEQAEIRLVDAMPPSVVELDNVRIAGEPVETESGNGASGESNVRLDVIIDLPNRIYVNGRGLTSEWGGNLAVSGTAAMPVVAGRIVARRGTLDLLGKLFTLERGVVSFDGARNLDPTVDVLLTRESGDITGRIGVSGRASAPALKLSAVPALPEEEVLPRVLFGRSRQSLGGAQALQLAAGLQSLASGRAGVLDRTRAALGLDVLRLDAGDGDEGGSGISVGRYVTDKVYVGARQGFQGKPGQVVVEVEVRRNIVLDATVGQEERSGVGISWKKNF